MLTADPYLKYVTYPSTLPTISTDVSCVTKDGEIICQGVLGQKLPAPAVAFLLREYLLRILPLVRLALVCRADCGHACYLSVPDCALQSLLSDPDSYPYYDNAVKQLSISHSTEIAAAKSACNTH